MAYCTKEDIKDTLLKVEQSDIDEAMDYIDNLARSMGVASIVSPAPYEVKQLAMAYACMRRALYFSGKPARGQSDGDSYAIKCRQYQKDVQLWEAKLTPELLSGRSKERRKFPVSIPVFRG